MSTMLDVNSGFPLQESTDPLVRLERAISLHASRPGALIPLLQEAQEIFGYLPETVLHRIAAVLHKSFSEVAGVVGFYSFFSRRPCGRHTIRVCLGTACYVRGAQRILDTFEHALAVKVGETTADRRYTLEVARCLGACGIAPACLVDKDVHQSLRPTGIPAIVQHYE